MNQKLMGIRILIVAIACYFVFKETGPVTAVMMFLMYVSHEGLLRNIEGINGILGGIQGNIDKVTSNIGGLIESHGKMGVNLNIVIDAMFGNAREGKRNEH